MPENELIHWRMETVERLARIEGNIEFIKSNIADLPQSRQCAADYAEVKKDLNELNKFREDIQKRIAYIGGVIVTIGMILPYILKWVAEHILHLKF